MGRIRDAWNALMGRSTAYPAVDGIPDIAEYLIGQAWFLQQASLEHIEAFEKVPMVHALITRLASDAAALPRVFYSGVGDDRTVLPERHPLVKLWNGGNPRQTGYEVERDLFSNFEIHNEAFLFLDRGRNARESSPIIGVWSLPSHLVEIVEGRQRVVEAYLWNRGGAREELEPWKVIHIRGFNAEDEPMAGSGWLAAAKEDYEAQYHALRLLKQFYLRGGWVPGVWEPADPNLRMTDAEAERLREKWRRGFQSLQGAWDAKFIQGMKQTKAGQTISELKLDEMIALVNANLCRVAGVPPWMMGIKEGGSLNSSGPGVDSVTYWSNTLPGRTRLVDRVLSSRLCKLFGDDLSCETDYSGVPALQRAQLDMIDAVVKATGGPVWSENEGRRVTGKSPDPRPEADKVRGPAVAQPVMPVPAPEAPAAKDQVQPEKSSNARRLRAADREQMRKVQDRVLARYEKRVAAWWESEVETQLGTALDRIDQWARRDGVDTQAAMMRKVVLALNPDDLMDEPDDSMRERARKLMESLIAERGAEVAASLGADVFIDAASATWKRYIQARVDRLIVGTTETTRALLREKVADALASGATYGEVVQVVRDVMEQRKGMAQTIARTETHGPYNAAAIEVWREVGIPGKSWLALHDDATRQSHLDAEAQGVIPIDQPFKVGDGFAMYPGETGIPEEDINCRCVVMGEDQAPARESWWPKGDERRALANGHANRLWSMFSVVR